MSRTSHRLPVPLNAISQEVISALHPSLKEMLALELASRLGASFTLEYGSIEGFITLDLGVWIPQRMSADKEMQIATALEPSTQDEIAIYYAIDPVDFVNEHPRTPKKLNLSKWRWVYRRYYDL